MLSPDSSRTMHSFKMDTHTVQNEQPRHVSETHKSSILPSPYILNSYTSVTTLVKHPWVLDLGTGVSETFQC